MSLEQCHELVANLQNLLIAGFLTTSALISTAVMHLLADRDQWSLLCSDPALIGAAVEESARFDPAIQGFRRVTTRPVTLGGTRLPAGATVLVAYASANRDERRHTDANRFDIRRPEDRRHLAFGHGPHNCPGARLARAGLHLTLELFSRTLPGLRLDGRHPAASMRPTLIHRSPETLYVTW